MIDFSESLRSKKFYRFTGTPENWLTAIKYMTWGLKKEYQERWEKIQPGDIFFMHSTGESIFNKGKSGIIGIGVVGADFSVKESSLWIEELEKKENLWPLLVPFSEIYLFSELPPKNLWEAPEPKNFDKVPALISALLHHVVPLSHHPQFPTMGSFSTVQFSVAESILAENKSLYEYRTETAVAFILEKPTQLQFVKNVS